MNDTAPPPPPPPPVQEGPQVTAAQLRDVGRLRRVHQGRKLAGVCGGLGRHFDIDPTIFRVLLVVLVFFGGAGLFLYAALWLLVPDEDSGRAVLDLGDDVAKVLVVVAAVVAAVLVLGHGWGGWWFGPSLPLGILVLLGVGYLITRDRRQQPRPQVAQAGSVAAPPVTDETAPLQASAPTATATATVPAPPRWSPPAYTPPSRPKRSGPVLFWPTMALVAVALGCLGVYDAGHHVATGAYWALALGIVGAGLVLGAFRGRPGGLVLAGLLSVAGLLGSLVAGGVRSAQDLSYDPAQSADVRSTYQMQTGEMVLDLSNLSDVAALEGRTVRLHGNVGLIEVVVPREATVRVDADVRTAGGITIGSLYDRSALGGSSAGFTLRGPAGAPTLTIDADLRVGQIDVRYPR